MPFPRVKGQVYEYSNHLPLAIMWKNGIKDPGKKINSLVSFIDFAPTIFDVAGISSESSGMQEMQGLSLRSIFNAEQSESVIVRDYVLVGKERHDVGRPGDVGYPVRGIIKNGFLYLQNFKPGRWPAGNPESGYLNTDGGPTKTVILNHRRSNGKSLYWDLNFGKRPEEEIYNIKDDPFCLQNLAFSEEYTEVKENLKLELANRLGEEGDPRITGSGDIFDAYIYANEADRNFYERFMNGDGVNAGWINESDYEYEKLD
jgi:arylsulfatase A-like enzyme